MPLPPTISPVALFEPTIIFSYRLIFSDQFFLRSLPINSPFFNSFSPSSAHLDRSVNDRKERMKERKDVSGVVCGPSVFIVHPLSTPGSHGGVYQRKLYRDLMENYNRLERPVQNDSAPIVVELGLTLLQIIDVVSV